MPFCRRRANTKGILALIGLQASFAVYLVALQRYLARRPFPFSFFARASACGAAAVAVTAAAHGDFADVSACRLVPARLVPHQHQMGPQELQLLC